MAARSTGRASTPAPSGSRRRWARPTGTATATTCRRWPPTADELVALAAAVGDHDGHDARVHPVRRRDPPSDRMALMADMAAAAGRPAQLEPAGQPLARRDLRAAAGRVRRGRRPGRRRGRPRPARRDAPAHGTGAGRPARPSPRSSAAARSTSGARAVADPDDPGPPAGRASSGPAASARWRRWPTATWSSSPSPSTGAAARWPRWPPSRASTPSTCSSTWSWSSGLALTMVLPTLVPVAGRHRRGLGAPGSRCGGTPGSGSAAPTPAPTPT